MIRVRVSSPLKNKIRKALKDEGGAAGMDALEKHTGASKEQIDSAVNNMHDVAVHRDGDYILDDNSRIDVDGTQRIDEKKKRKKKRKKKKRKKKAGTESSKESSLRDWFGRRGGKGKPKGWVDCNTCRKDKKTGRKKCKPCGRQKGEKRSKYPACRPTPGACEERGRGKSWGKKSKKGKK